MKNFKSAYSLQKPLTMYDFGTVHGNTQEVRVNLLENRLNPKVPFPHRHDFYQIVVMMTGSGWHEIDFRRLPAGPLQIYFSKPGQVHDWNISAKTTGFVIEFGREAVVVQSSNLIHPTWSVDQLADHFDLSTIPKRRCDIVCGLFKLMHDEYENEATDFETALRHYLMALLIDLRRCVKAKVDSTWETDPVLEGFIDLVEANFKEEHEVEFYAKKLKTTSKAITMRVQRSLGKSARTLIKDRCLLEAKRLLAYSNFVISDIGYELGFDDPNYFSRFFKRHSGLNPSEFREKAKNSRLN
ncbi:MAG: helix-turn-helix domain-containing protein [Pseudobdellovibrio sp.]